MKQSENHKANKEENVFDPTSGRPKDYPFPSRKSLRNASLPTLKEVEEETKKSFDWELDDEVIVEEDLKEFSSDTKKEENVLQRVSTSPIPLKKPSRKKRNWIYWAAGAVVGLVAIAIILWVLLYDTSITVPAAAKSASVDNATEVCEPFEEVELGCSVEWVYSPAISGSLISQSIAPGEEVKKGEVIEIRYSKGEENVVVPNLNGLELKNAEILIAESGLTLGEVSEVDADGLKAGLVLESSVEAGETVPNGETVDLVISSGLYTMPDWIGLPSEAVGVSASELGIETTFLEQEDSGPSGIVLSQSIEPGTKTKDRNVEITISKAAVVDALEIPDVIGKSSEEAQILLAEAGFTKFKVIEVPSSAAPGVFQTVPGAGQTAASSETVVIVVTVSE